MVLKGLVKRKQVSKALKITGKVARKGAKIGQAIGAPTIVTKGLKKAGKYSKKGRMLIEQRS